MSSAFILGTPYIRKESEKKRLDFIWILESHMRTFHITITSSPAPTDARHLHASNMNHQANFGKQTKTHLHCLFNVEQFCKWIQDTKQVGNELGYCQK